MIFNPKVFTPLKLSNETKFYTLESIKKISASYTLIGMTYPKTVK